MWMARYKIRRNVSKMGVKGTHVTGGEELAK
jgi:hypothetical protein